MSERARLPRKEFYDEPQFQPQQKSAIGIGFNTGLSSNLSSIPEPAPVKQILPTQEDKSVVIEPAPDPKKVAVKKNQLTKKMIRMKILLWIRDISIAILVAILIMQFVRPTIVQQHSMEDTFHENDYVFLNRQAYNFGEIKHGDIFVFKHTPPLGASGVEKNLIKRVIGLPGDEVAIHDGKVYVNGEAIDDSYTKDGYTDGQMDPMLIPDNYIFALGDNRQNSFDSRDPMLGLIDMRDVIGKAVFRVFPLSDAGLVK